MKTTCSLSGVSLGSLLRVLGRLQSLAKLGGAPSIFLMVLPDLLRVRLKEAAWSWAGGEGEEGEVMRDRSRGETRGLTVIQECRVNITSLTTVLTTHNIS